jgi:hypothetical protein
MPGSAFRLPTGAGDGRCGSAGNRRERECSDSDDNNCRTEAGKLVSGTAAAVLRAARARDCRNRAATDRRSDVGHHRRLQQLRSVADATHCSELPK